MADESNYKNAIDVPQTHKMNSSHPASTRLLHANDEYIDEEQLRTDFRAYLARAELHYTEIISDEIPTDLTGPKCTSKDATGLQDLCIGWLREKPEFRDIVAATKGNDFHFPLMVLRMMQLDLAGVQHSDTICVESLKYDRRRLAKLVFESKDGIDGFDTEVLEKDSVICGICKNYVNVTDEYTILPCSSTEPHKVRPKCLEEWAETSKRCPYCQEYIL